MMSKPDNKFLVTIISSRLILYDISLGDVKKEKVYYMAKINVHACKFNELSKDWHL